MQDIMEKSHSDLKYMRFQRLRLTWLNDFVHFYQFSDSTHKKNVRVIIWIWNLLLTSTIKYHVFNNVSKHICECIDRR